MEQEEIVLDVDEETYKKLLAMARAQAIPVEMLCADIIMKALWRAA